MNKTEKSPTLKEPTGALCPRYPQGRGKVRGQKRKITKIREVGAWGGRQKT